MREKKPLTAAEQTCIDLRSRMVKITIPAMWQEHIRGLVQSLKQQPLRELEHKLAERKTRKRALDAARAARYRERKLAQND